MKLDNCEHIARNWQNARNLPFDEFGKGDLK